MPHIIVEYTSGLSDHIDLQNLLEILHQTLGARSDANIGPERIVSRAHQTSNYIIYDGSVADHFIDIELRLVPGRSEQLVKELCTELQDTTRRFLKSKNVECVIKVNPVDLSAQYCG